MKFKNMDIAVNDYLMIDTYESMKERFYCGYVYYVDDYYIHLCSIPYDDNFLNQEVKVAVPIVNIIGIHKKTVADCDLGI